MQKSKGILLPYYKRNNIWDNNTNILEAGVCLFDTNYYIIYYDLATLNKF